MSYEHEESFVSDQEENSKELFGRLEHIAGVCTNREVSTAQRLLGNDQLLDGLVFPDSLMFFLEKQMHALCPQELLTSVQTHRELVDTITNGPLRPKEQKDILLQLHELTLHFKKNADEFLQRFVVECNARIFEQLLYDLPVEKISEDEPEYFLTELDDDSSRHALASVLAVTSLDVLSMVNVIQQEMTDHQLFAKEASRMLLNPAHKAVFYHRLAKGYIERIHALMNLVPFSSLKLQNLTLGFDDIRVVRDEQILDCPPQGLTLFIHYPFSASMLESLYKKDVSSMQSDGEVIIGNYAPEIDVRPGDVLVMNISPGILYEHAKARDSDGLREIIQEHLKPFMSCSRRLKGKMFAVLDVTDMESLGKFRKAVGNGQFSAFIEDTIVKVEDVDFQTLKSIDSNKLDNMVLNMEEHAVMALSYEEERGTIISMNNSIQVTRRDIWWERDDEE